MATRKIGGIAYREINETTMEMDAAILREVRSLGMEKFEKAESESGQEFLERILLELIEGGQAFGLLGCFLVPEGTEWTAKVARQTADIFRGITDANDKAQLRSALIPYLFSFFAIGLASAATSQRFSAVLRGILGQPGNAATSTSENGATSPGRSRVGILSALWKWLAGRFAKRSSPTSMS